MTDVPSLPPRFRPWLSVWFKPRVTIEQILARDPTHLVLVLAAISAIASVVSHLFDAGLAETLLDWRVGAVVVLGGAILGIIGLYVSGFFYRWAGRVFGGPASQVEMRAVIAWGLVPIVVGLAISLIVLVGLKLSGSADALTSTSSAAMGALRLVAWVVALWSVITTMLMFARVERFGFWRTIGGFGLAYLVIVIFAFAAAVTVRTLLFQPFSMPSGSMEPTLIVGDYFFVSKYRYGYSHYALPFSPRLFSGRVLASEPQAGDLVVFRLPKDDTTDYIKRLVGMPGDRIQMINGALNINGQPVQREPAEDFIDPDEGPSPIHVKRWHETLPNGVSYYTLQRYDNSFYDNTPPYMVPPGHYFVMGDNRQNSTDSRVLSAVGYVPFENLIGRAEIIFFSSDPGRKAVRLERIGTIVR